MGTVYAFTENIACGRERRIGQADSLVAVQKNSVRSQRSEESWFALPAGHGSSVQAACILARRVKNRDIGSDGALLRAQAPGSPLL
jgi:mannitol-specific phosphotransferase system IIBC component